MPSANVLFVLSLSKNPIFNLSLEHALLRRRHGNQVIGLLYRNEACIVIGRNQNPWSELDILSMRSLGLKMVRRRSGGGAVYHDEGNTNYSFHTSKDDFKRRTHSELVAHALNNGSTHLHSALLSDLGDSKRGAYVNSRNDICVSVRNADSDLEERKISGSAYKLTSAGAYHHGTMLLSSDLSKLGTTLKPSRASMISRGVMSVPSPVVNLTEAFRSRQDFLSHQHFCTSVHEAFEQAYGPSKSLHVDGTAECFANLPSGVQEEIERSCAEMSTWDWTWGQTPSFSYRIRYEEAGELDDATLSISPFELDLEVRNGLIVSSIVRADVLGVEDEDVLRFANDLRSQRYDDLANSPDTFDVISSQTSSDDAKIGHHLDIDQCSPRYTVVTTRLKDWLRNVL